MLSFKLLQKKDAHLICGINEDFRDYKPERVKAFLSEPQNIAFTAELDGKIIGLIHGYSLTRMDSKAPQFFIYAVDIVPVHQDKGYGSAFIQYVVDWAREHGFSESFVLTDKDNHRACRVYEKAGMTYSKEDCGRMYEIGY